MMIALAILAMGLLVIAAAMPVGMRYTRDSVDIAAGDAAAQYGLSRVEQVLRLKGAILDPSNSNALIWEPTVFEPRRGASDPNPGTRALDPPGTRRWEPLIKVRPLHTGIVRINPGSPPSELLASGYVPSEVQIGNWLTTVWGLNPDVKEEADFPVASFSPKQWLRQALPSVAMAYPPVMLHGAQRLTPEVYYSAWPNSMYTRRPVTYGTNIDNLTKVKDRLISWVAFYRRVSYAEGADPRQYEIIVVSVRRPSAAHRFPTMVSGTSLVIPANLSAIGYQGNDSLSPVPFLVAFEPNGLPVPPWIAPDGERVLPPNFVPPPRLLFRASDAVGPLLPAGSIFIPAVNDLKPSALNGQSPPFDQAAGLVPEAPDILPIFEVDERVKTSTGYDVFVKINGSYPWVRDDLSTNYWPVWVIPPAFESLDSSGEPILLNESPVLSVARRIVNVRELP